MGVQLYNLKYFYERFIWHKQNVTIVDILGPFRVVIALIAEPVTAASSPQRFAIHWVKAITAKNWNCFVNLEINLF
jgi:hypothetical protein